MVRGSFRRGVTVGLVGVGAPATLPGPERAQPLAAFQTHGYTQALGVVARLTQPRPARPFVEGVPCMNAPSVDSGGRPPTPNGRSARPGPCRRRNESVIPAATIALQNHRHDRSGPRPLAPVLTPSLTPLAPTTINLVRREEGAPAWPATHTAGLSFWVICCSLTIRKHRSDQAESLGILSLPIPPTDPSSYR